ncbi:MAG: hypothetical protein K0S41_2580 [Anaerocolumna sp.]|jgi:hypothetical protein|nr:hypothetical protein [Anaerocolumna sp.]
MKVIAKEDLIIKDSMCLSFYGADIWFEQLDTLNIYKDVVIEKFLKDMNTIKKPSFTGLMAINLDETLVDLELVAILINNLQDAAKYIRKVVFVGLDRKVKNMVNSMIKKLDQPIGFIYAFENDYEKAKLWLVKGQ